jgi:hypothetical protein
LRGWKECRKKYPRKKSRWGVTRERERSSRQGSGWIRLAREEKEILEKPFEVKIGQGERSPRQILYWMKLEESRTEYLREN